MNRGVSVFAVMALVTTLGVSACGKKPPAPAPAAPPPPPAAAPATTPTAPPPPPPAPAPAPTRVPTEDEIFSKKTTEELTKELGTVYFELDSAQIDDAARPVVQKNSEWMKRWTSTQVMIEGHADSRGTAEYNLALGERRAAAVRDYLVSLGIPAARVQIVSKGKESPICSEEAESCWKQNRRGYFIVTAK